MKKLNENFNASAMSRGNFANGLPFYGSKGDFNFTSGKSQFTPGISVKQVPLTDMSVKGDTGYSELDMMVGRLRQNYKPGDRIRGVIINSQVSSDRGKVIVGKLHKLLPNYMTGEIRAWVKDPKTLKLTEVYVDTIEKLYENRALSFSQFINS
jgi:hypothetical protein